MSVQRLYEKALDQVLISPTPLRQFLTGQVIGGSLRGLYAGGILILITLPLRTGLVFNLYSVFIMLLNGGVFSTIALTLSFLSKSYSDAPRYNAYIITPMSFLCNTFFSTDRLPGGVARIVALLLLSQASGMLRSLANGQRAGGIGVIVLLVYLAFFGLLSVWYIYRKENM